MCAFDFKTSAGDSEVERERPGKRDDERNEHPENREGGFLGERGDDERETEPKFELRINQAEQVVDEIGQKLVLGDKNCESLGILDFEKARRDEEKSDADAEKRFEAFDSKVLVLFVGEKSGENGEDQRGDSDVQIVFPNFREFFD